MHHWHAVCRTETLQPGDFLEFTLADAEPGPDVLPRTGFVFLEGDAPKAYLNRCPHLGIELNWMPGRFMDPDNLFLQCSTHGALFKPSNGECIAGPCQGDALIALDLRNNHGVLEVRVPAAPK